MGQSLRLQIRSLGLDDLVGVIHENYERVRETINLSALRCGRNPAHVKLVVVSKAQTITVIEAAVKAGIRVFGENYPEEAIEKTQHFRAIKDIEWHMIGHLQSRKARLIIDSFCYLHSLDSMHLAEKLNSLLSANQKSLPVLLEMNVSGEESKFGWPAWDEDRWIDLVPIFNELINYHQIKISGLMTMPPFFEDSEKARPYFIKLRKLSDFLALKIPDMKWRELSMGTSIDFAVAVEEGATFVRVGQAILGSRPAKSV